MLKIDELNNPKSCLNRADDHEYVFTLLGRDVAAPVAIVFWILVRVLFNKNRLNDPQIIEAFETAKAMEGQSKP